MDGIKFIHHKNVQRVYTGYREMYKNEWIFIVIWDGDRNTEAVPFHEKEFKNLFDKGIFIELTD